MIADPRDRYIAWLRWFLRTHPSVVGSQSALAKKIGITRGALTPLLATGSTRAPSFETMVAVRELTGIPVDVMMFCDPPEVDPAEVQKAVQEFLARR